MNKRYEMRPARKQVSAVGAAWGATAAFRLWWKGGLLEGWALAAGDVLLSCFWWGKGGSTVTYPLVIRMNGRGVVLLMTKECHDEKRAACVSDRIWLHDKSRK